VLPNPPIFEKAQSPVTVRELLDGEFVTVFLEGAEPVDVVAIPRAAVLADQQGSYVYVIGPGNRAEQRRIQLGQSSTTLAAVTSGLKVGEQVIAEGLQRVRAGEAVSPEPADTTLERIMQSSARQGMAGPAGPASPGGAGAGAPARAPAVSASPPAEPTGAAGPNAGGSPGSRR
jgi:membrane fusion protein (multidrug efflux system)